MLYVVDIIALTIGGNEMLSFLISALLCLLYQFICDTENVTCHEISCCTYRDLYTYKNLLNLV